MKEEYVLLIILLSPLLLLILMVIYKYKNWTFLSFLKYPSSIKCKLGFHAWSGCKCSQCSKTRDELHLFYDSDPYKCSNCGKTRDFDLSIEQANFLAAIKTKWGKGLEFYAGDAFYMISEDYLNWFTEEAIRKRIHCVSHRETATLELLESFRIQGLLSKRVAVRNKYGDEGWYYTLK
jgi:hypothetical protein